MSHALQLQTLQYCLFVFFGAIACIGVSGTIANLFGATPAEKQRWFFVTVALIFGLYTVQFVTSLFFLPQILDALFGPAPK